MIHGRIRLLLTITCSLFAAQSAVAAPVFSVFFHQATNFTGTKRTKLNNTADLLERVVNSESFRKAVLNHRTKSIRNGVAVYTRSFVQNEGMSNAQVLDFIYEATENFYNESKYNPPRGNETADFYVKLYSGTAGVVGHTTTGRRLININNYYFSSMSKAYMAGNLMHEWLHKLGFGHDVTATSRRPYSVPYAVGNIVRNLATSLSKSMTTSKAMISGAQSAADAADLSDEGSDDDRGAVFIER